MSHIVLSLKQQPALRVDMRGITPKALSTLSLADIERLVVHHGTQALPLAEFFTVSTMGSEASLPDTLRLEGDLSRFDRVGWQMDAGQLVVQGHVGDYAGACMSGGSLHVQGNVARLAACEMAGGTLTIDGNAGDFAASTLPGSMDGMRGGTLLIKGRAGDRFADRMRRGTAVVFGDVGDFAASRMVAGTVALGGDVGAHLGFGMRRGSVVLARDMASNATPISPTAPTFVPALVDAAVFWQLLSRDLVQHGGPFAGLPSRRVQRRLGDVAFGGKGELIFAL